MENRGEPNKRKEPIVVIVAVFNGLIFKIRVQVLSCKNECAFVELIADVVDCSGIQKLVTHCQRPLAFGNRYRKVNVFCGLLCKVVEKAIVKSLTIRSSAIYYSSEKVGT